jgi:2-amino-4-hydroxy-6-hydroxymethyldihydropteridine diphosphokinase
MKQAWKRVSRLLTSPLYSSLWESAPLIVEDQPAFYNMVFSGVYSGDAESLLDALNGIEADLGRNRAKEISKGPRTMDLDILLFGEEDRADERLVIPHPGVCERAFVLRPLLEIMPDDEESYFSYKVALDKLTDQELYCRDDRRSSGFFLENGGEHQ